MHVFKKIISWSLFIGWMGLIFYLSHQPSDASKALSTNFGEPLRQFLQLLQIEIAANDFQFWIRKAAHFSAYMLLGVFAFLALKNSFQKVHFLVVLNICVFYALTDEVHQTYIPGRSGEVRDVLIDSAGALLGISLCYLFVYFYNNLKQNRP